MKKILLALLFLNTISAHAQLSANILLPNGGMIEKPQLWNMIVTSTEPGPLTVQVQVRFAEQKSGQAIFVASSAPFMISQGTTQINAGTIGSVSYNILNMDYGIDPGPTGLLPAGTFYVCYDFIISKYNKVVQECRQVDIPSIGSLLLTEPLNEETIKKSNPVFRWLPLSSVNVFNNLKYELRLVEIFPGQTAPDAMNENATVFTIDQLGTTDFQYLQNAPPLEADRRYAWQIAARNNLSVIAKSEVWSFSTKKDAGPGLFIADPVYTKIKKQGIDDGYALFRGNLRFDYLNESADTSWNIMLKDLTVPRHTGFQLFAESIKLTKGQNLVNYEAANDSRFIDKHQYLLTVSNSKNEVWELRFEYRKPE